MKDSEILERLIYRAYIAPDPHAPLEEAVLLPFATALRLYAKTCGTESSTACDADACPVEYPEPEPVSIPDTPPEPEPPDTHTHTHRRDQ